MGKWLNRTNIAAALLAVAAVVYQLVVVLPASERPKWDKERAAARQPELEQCGEAALLIHDVHWASACMLLAKEVEARHAACLRDPLVMDNPQLGKAHCDRTFGDQDDSPECMLPPARAATLNASLKDAEDRCLAQVKAESPPTARKSAVPRD